MKSVKQILFASFIGVCLISTMAFANHYEQKEYEFKNTPETKNIRKKDIANRAHLMSCNSQSCIDAAHNTRSGQIRRGHGF